MSGGASDTGGCSPVAPEDKISGFNRIYRLPGGRTGHAQGKGRKRDISIRVPLLVEAKANARWSLDFVHDRWRKAGASGF